MDKVTLGGTTCAYISLLHVKSQRHVRMWNQHVYTESSLLTVYSQPFFFLSLSHLLRPVLQVWPGCDRQLPAVAWFHTLAATPLPPTPTHPAWETTGHRAGASLYGLEQGSQPNQYLCISCPFAQVSSLIITAWRSFNALAGWAKGRACVTFPRPCLDLDHLHRREDTHNKAT